MRAKLSALLLVFLLFSPVAQAGYGGFSFSKPHYQRHMLASYGLNMTTYMGLRAYKVKRQPSLWIAAGSTLFLGLLYAFFHHTQDSTYSVTDDMLANGIGVAGATGAAIVIQF
jgi:hypothetical protein